MAGAKNHDYHILPPSPWPLMGSLTAGILAVGGILWMKDHAFGPAVFALGFAGVLATMYFWWADVVREARSGDHTPVVQLHLRYGMILFIASEVMFFVGWFWAYFDFSLFPALIGYTPGAHGEAGTVELLTEGVATWPPKGLEVLNAFELPLLNTFILLLSGTTVTWAHHALIHGDRDGLKKGLWCTILLGAVFSCIQAYEYAHAPFPFAGINYGASFFMATGFHGVHVLIGTIFLAVCLVRAYRGDFTPRQHFGFEAAAWYWHFVDVVWLFLFVSIYVWGGWGAPVHG
ncbi:cytochrome c oxidase subunit 3 [Sphingomonas guangdongensis]|uniref:Cytochrome c oxidase subunit 3 n=1 Tax=Sphingomonas guangdongensis TaxID=1141890 RepID=A0A285QHP7_9SPHN|nr:cytochrome c oxidase subunit 3 [Sphingomonas guangdongensis]SOB79592.1 cytochrome c oxidase subunit 3 [Sphingomonas guangdongensis]